MGDPVDRLFQEWHQAGGAVLLGERSSLVPVRPVEALIGESTAHCRSSGRLTWVVLDWLTRHIQQIDERALLRNTREEGDLAVLGVLCDAAHERQPHPKFDFLMRQCPKNERLEPFFHRVARSPLASHLAQENSVDVFRRWNFLSHELRYLSDG